MEHIRTPKVESVRLLDRFNTRRPAIGTLYLTTTHLIFVDPAGKKETWILHMHICSVEKLPLTTAGSPLLIRCRTFQCVTFVVPRERDCHDIYMSLLRLSQPAELDELYAFQYTCPDQPDKTKGWDLFEIQSEFLRMGVPNNLWVLSPINKEFEICDTYSKHLYVPACASTPVLMGSARFRSRGRFPVLSYLHRDNNASICRCSQPLSGFSARCVEDEQMLQAILRANPSSNFMYVVDTRPKINAMANKAAGKGYENENFYTNIKFKFLGIENIHVMRASLQKLIDVCELKNPSMNAYLSGLESSGWLKHVKAVVDTSVFIAKAVIQGTSVLVHCSDGWDRTAQVCSLAGIMLDPYYRTIQGFQALIEKEWLSFGHKFMDRCGYLGTVDPKETSPVFTQFIDAVWQLMQQFPQAFQFNEHFLLTVHDHAYSCQFGTFIGNCEKDRIDLRLRERTYSLWAYLLRCTSDFFNPFYKRELEITMPTLMPDCSPQGFKLWLGMYNRFENGVHPRENLMDIISAMTNHTLSLEDHIRLLEKRIHSLCKLLGKSEDEVKQALQCLNTSESLDFSTLVTDSNLSMVGKAPVIDYRKHISGDLNGPGLSPEGDNTRHSDSESGFEDASSQMSKSLVDEGSNSLHNSSTVLSQSYSSENLQVDHLLLEMHSVAVDWQPLRKVSQCSCALPFEHYTRKYHCWKCGDVFCTRCIGRWMPLPGHLSKRPVPVCKACYKELKKSPSPSFQDLREIGYLSGSSFGS